MLIRSQNKKSIVNLDNINEIYTYKNIPKDRTMILPEYETDTEYSRCHKMMK